MHFVDAVITNMLCTFWTTRVCHEQHTTLNRASCIPDRILFSVLDQVVFDVPVVQPIFTIGNVGREAVVTSSHDMPIVVDDHSTTLCAWILGPGGKGSGES